MARKKVAKKKKWQRKKSGKEKKWQRKKNGKKKKVARIKSGKKKKQKKNGKKMAGKKWQKTMEKWKNGIKIGMFGVFLHCTAVLSDHMGHPQPSLSGTGGVSTGIHPGRAVDQQCANPLMLHCTELFPCVRVRPY